MKIDDMIQVNDFDHCFSSSIIDIKIYNVSNLHFSGSKQEDYYLDEYDRIMDTGNLTPKESKISEEILKLGAWQSEDNEESDSASTPREIYASIEVSREDLMEAKKDRLLLGFLKNKKVRNAVLECE